MDFSGGCSRSKAPSCLRLCSHSLGQFRRRHDRNLQASIPPVLDNISKRHFWLTSYRGNLRDARGSRNFEIEKAGIEIRVLDGHRRKEGRDGPMRSGAWYAWGSFIAFAQKIKVDYSQQDPSATLRLYIDCGKASIEEGNSLGLLYMLWGREKHPGLPSWCPDLDARQSSKLLRHPEWKAGVKNLPGGERQPSTWFEPGCDDLHAPGCRVDIVSEVVKSTYCWSDMERDRENPSGEDGANNLLWESECLALARQTFTQQGDIPDAYILTLCEGFLNPYENDPYMIREAYKRNISLWHYAAKSIPHEDVDQRLRSVAHHLVSRLMQNCQGRKLFTTNRGRIGVGPPETQAGDEVYSLHGAGPLYLLRSEDDAIKILGNVYIHELMNFDETPEDTMEENDFVVIN
jgi:hypothetical protein